MKDKLLNWATQFYLTLCHLSSTIQHSRYSM